MKFPMLKLQSLQHNLPFLFAYVNAKVSTNNV